MPRVSPEEMIGLKCGRLIVLAFDSIHVRPNGDRQPYWQCRCECGSETTVAQGKLRRRAVQSCGCLTRERAAEANRLPSERILGQKFGRWTPLRYEGTRKTSGGGYNSRWLCRCDCGTEQVVPQSNLMRGWSKSCGCLQLDLRTTLTMMEAGGPPSSPERGKQSPEYKAWVSMHQRCSNPKRDHYDRYGGRGIKVCERWSSFKLFLEDMGKRPSGKHSIDRKENDGDYTPDNCRWATKLEQMSNTRTSVIVEWQGEIIPRAALARRYGQDPKRLASRLRSGWGLERALLTP